MLLGGMGTCEASPSNQLPLVELRKHSQATGSYLYYCILIDERLQFYLVDIIIVLIFSILRYTCHFLDPDCGFELFY